MVNKEFLRLPLSELVPYDNNPRLNDEAVDDVVRSMEQVGALDPIEVDENNVILSGHTRLRAMLQRGDTAADVIRYTGLTEEQKIKYRLLANKTAEKATWDFSRLTEELDKVNFGEYDFGFVDAIAADMDAKLQVEENKEIAHERFQAIENLNKAQYEGEGPYDIPVLQPVYDLPRIDSWIDFDHVLREKEPEGKGVHFFIHDYKFQRLWVQPEQYIEKLRRFAVVAAPDFSPYGDMPHAMQIYNHYRKHWVGRFLQERGVTVIPTIRASTDPRSMDWYLDGEPHGGIVMISSMWCKEDDDAELVKKAYRKMRDALKPSKIIVYGNKTKHMGIAENDPVEYIQYVHNADF